MNKANRAFKVHKAKKETQVKKVTRAILEKQVLKAQKVLKARRVYRVFLVLLGLMESLRTLMHRTVDTLEQKQILQNFLQAILSIKTQWTLLLKTK